MDPVGPWSAYASYNRLAGVQAGAASGDFHHHLTSGGSGLSGQSVPSTTSQLLLQAAHTTASLAGQLGSSTASPFNPGGFLSPPAVGYDAVFSPLFHHANPKPAHYSSSLQAQHRQVIAQAQAAVASKQSSVESELSSLRENYSHQTLAAQGTASFFDQSTTPGGAGGLSWQGNNQLPSPFGILPHESVVPSSPSPATTKASATYDNFNAHFAAAQTLNNHLNSQISSAGKQSNRSGSPASASKQPASSTSSSTFFQSPSTFGSQTDSAYSSSSAKSGQLSSQQDYAGSKSYSGSASSTTHSQQSCIVSTPTVTSSLSSPSKDFRSSSSSTSRTSSSVYNSQSPKNSSSEKSPRQSSGSASSFVSPTTKAPQVQTKAQSKIYPELSSEQRKSCESSDKLQPQSSPISYSIMDAPGRLNYSTSSGTTSSKSNRIGNSQYSSTHNSSFRHYQSGNNVESDYHVRAKSSSSTDTGYSSSSSQNGPDCSGAAPRRPSPLQAPAQTSPLGHGSSPAYPMYHSPMNSTNSPQQHGDHYSKVNSTAPRSPLDASVSRPSSQNSQVAYPSVITRALGIEQSKTYSENRYERTSNQSSTPGQTCWDGDRQASRKYSSSSNSNNYSNNGLSESNNTHNEESVSQSTSHRTLNLAEKQHGYFDGTNVALQDLSSCRGDPMSIVKNLQTLQQSCQLQEIKSSKSQTPVSAPTKVTPRRKSTEKTVTHNMNDISNAVMADYLANRIPPPAHSSTSNQQQNGTYFDFERWNLPPPPPKMFPGTSAFGSQATLHATNFNQHQALAMQHGHALTYFPPFHLGPHPDFQSSVELTPLSSFSETPPSASSSSFSTPETREEEQPKVVVPNIEEELGFLAEQRGNTSSVAPSSQQQNLNSTSQDATSKIMEKKFNVPVTGPGSGFMASYLKFLQGERDTSPPPAGRGARKSTWSRTTTNNTNNKIYPHNDHVKCDGNPAQSSNGAMGANVINSAMSLSNPAMTAPSMSSAGLMGANQLQGASSNLLGSQAKGIELDDPRYYINKDRKRKYDGSEESSYDAEEEARRSSKPVLNVPSTPLSDKGKKGRAPSKPPAAVVAPQPAAPKKPRAPAPPPGAALQAAPHQQYYYQHQPDEVAHSTNLGYGSYGAADNESNANRKLHHIKSHQQLSTGQVDDSRPGQIEEMPYQSGEFVAIKSELNEMWPSIWRVDGKTLLQKYEPFEENGKVLYRNISTYAAWNPENKKLYTQVSVKVRSQSHLETIVELVRSELQFDDCNFIEKRMLETQMYQENFEVYIQTLISHALDPNFLTEIFQEQDEYFLSNVKTVDEVTETMRSRVSSGGGGGGSGGGGRALDSAVGTWPGLSVAAGAGACRACGRPAAARLLLYGQPYNPATLEPVQPDARLAYEKEFLVCATCCGRVQLYSRISHQKYLMYAECSKRVAEKRMQNPSKDTTVILNELLADELWLSQLFRDVRHSWAEAESWERKLRHALARHVL
ncbi:serine-rich adhesin for platelets-like isoform X1 [Cydia pomonella]|uniref:serine-rich adhesin for platelets-like isoform X1 n=1 Tax=Cydia pomonella TaxID=82600 RepID=UPI002ADE8C0E|nr:serine-rich adhesin for platelets-like isoform X1 [Cydia pomonella]